MILARRACLILLAALAVSLALLPLGHTPWAEQQRVRAERDALRFAPPAQRKVGASDSRPRPRNALNQVTRAFTQSAFQIGIPAGLTLLALAVIGRRRKPSAAKSSIGG